MIRVLVVEDEIPIQRNICKMIEKEDQSFMVTQRAQNGEDALEILKKEEGNIDLMFLDIHMPVMDGIEVLKYLRNNDLEIPTVILSGFQDFNYARESMRYGVIDYLLKPINRKKLGKVLRDAEYKIIQEAYNKHMHSGGSNACEYEVALVYFGNKWLSRGKRSIGLMLHATEKEAMDYLEQYLYRNMGNDEFWIIKDNYEPEWYLIFKNKSYKVKKVLMSLLDFGIHKNFNISILLDDKLQSINTIYSKRLQMSEDIQHIMRLGENSFHYGSVEQESKKRKEEMLTLIKEVQQVTVTEELGKVIIDTISKCNLRTSVMVEVLTFAIQNYSSQFEMNNERELVIQEVYQTVEESKSFHDLIEGIDRVILRTFNSNDRRDRKKKISHDIMAYLEANYKKNISMEDLSVKFGFVQDYLRSIFSREVGMTPMEYLQNIRMTETKRLLVERPTLPFKEIALQVGYNDPSYYSRVFKKTQGCSPSVFRKNNLEL